jgi:hypothetical protein
MKHVTAVRFTPHTVSFKLDGVPVQDTIRVAPRVPMVGHYFMHRPVVLVDRKIQNPRERQSVALHEALERHLRYYVGLGPLQAHRIAEREETRWDTRQGIPLRPYERDVEKVFRQNAREGVRRRR